jgi:hypothetical protein
MFTTYPRAEITFDTPDYKKTHAEQRVWSFVEQELLLPWIYLQVTRRSGQEDYGCSSKGLARHPPNDDT